MNYTLASARIFPPDESAGWTIHFIERDSRYWIGATAGKKEEQLFEQGTKQISDWSKRCKFIRMFTDGERRYGQQLWKLDSVYLKSEEYHRAYGRSQVWREGLEVAMKIKGSQGHGRVEWVKFEFEHSFTAISSPQEVHANHNEAQNASLRRRCSAYRRRQNLYAKKLTGWQRVLDVQRLVHNWVRPHWGLASCVTPAMAMGLCSRPVTMLELLTNQSISFMSF